MVGGVKPTPARAPTNILYIPVDTTPKQTIPRNQLGLQASYLNQSDYQELSRPMTNSRKQCRFEYLLCIPLVATSLW